MNECSHSSHRKRWWSVSVIERDDYTCQECGAQKDLQAHHIVSIDEDPSKALDLDNGITLCRNCHRKKHTIYVSDVQLGGKTSFIRMRISEELHDKFKEYCDSRNTTMSTVLIDCITTILSENADYLPAEIKNTAVYCPYCGKDING